MHHFSPGSIEQLLQSWGYLGIFVCVLIGNVGIPVPEETVVLAAGFLAGRGILGLKEVIVVALISAVVGDNLGYLVGRTGGRHMLNRLTSSWRGFARRYVHFRAFFRAHGEKAVLISRFVAGLRFMAGPMAGAARMPFARFFVWNVLGAILWCSAVSYVGFLLGDQWEWMAGVVHRAGHWIMLGLVLTAAVLLYRLLTRPRLSVARRLPGTAPIKPE